jgi:tRNA G18 (ribose-2'-O)-methylase SpoU
LVNSAPAADVVCGFRALRCGVPLVPLTRAEDERLADYRNLPDGALLSQRGIFIAEGRLVVARLLESDRFATRSMMMTQTAFTAFGREHRDLLARRGEVPIFIVPQAVIDAVAGFNVHRGCLAVGERAPAAGWRTLLERARRIVVLEAVGNADNVGAIFRSAAAFDADAVLLGPGCADPLYRKAIRTSMAASLAVPFASVDPWPFALTELPRDRFLVIGLAPGAAAPLEAVAAAVAGRCAVLLAGHEGDGLSAAALQACHEIARIPTSARVDSLNVATAVAIALYAITPQGGRESLRSSK